MEKKVIELTKGVFAVIEYSFRTVKWKHEVEKMNQDDLIDMRPIIDSIAFLQHNYTKEAFILTGQDVGTLMAAVTAIKELPVQQITASEYFA